MLVEGAGSASEINLRAGDIANMGFARAADVSVVIVGDIDRGGVIASLVGTHAVLDPADRAMVAGFIVNRMRGDPLAVRGRAWPRSPPTPAGGRSGWCPFSPDAHRLPAEDAADLAFVRRPGAPVRIVVPALPWISNFDDLDPLAAEPEVDLVLVPRGSPLPVCDLIILPGSKATIADLAAFRAEGWDMSICGPITAGAAAFWGFAAATRCWGGASPTRKGWRGHPMTVAGIGATTLWRPILGGDKRLVEVSWHARTASRLPGSRCMSGAPQARRRLLVRFSGRAARMARCRADGLVAGCYVHATIQS